ncbi:hypothetical protein LJK88_08050 [Paenibacillus sp. P26]|nr:hypothetical protein LJK88_08050 [Paenibacillus sp. P26]
MLEQELGLSPRPEIDEWYNAWKRRWGSGVRRISLGRGSGPSAPSRGNGEQQAPGWDPAPRGRTGRDSGAS